MPLNREELTDTALARSLDGDFTSDNAEVNGVRLHYVTGGEGHPLVLLGGWPQNWWQFHKIMPTLAREHRVIAVDIRGQGGSAKPEDGYDKKTMAADIHALARHLGHDTVDVVGHDIGSMLAHALAATRPESVRRLAILDVPHPDRRIAELPLLPQNGQRANREPGGEMGGTFLWWFAFNQVKGLPERLLAGRERVFVDAIVDYLLADPASMDERTRDVYARAYSTPDAVRAGNAWYQAFIRDIEDLAGYDRLTHPVLGLASPGTLGMLSEALGEQAADARVVEVPGSGHYLAEEQPEFVADRLRAFLG